MYVVEVLNPNRPGGRFLASTLFSPNVETFTSPNDPKFSLDALDVGQIHVSLTDFMNILLKKNIETKLLLGHYLDLFFKKNLGVHKINNTRESFKFFRL